MPFAAHEDISYFEQSLFKKPHPAIRTSCLHESRLNHEVLQKFANHSVIGLAGEYKSGHLTHLVLATPHEVLRIRIFSPKSSVKGLQRTTLSQLILLDPEITLIAFNFDRLALALHCDVGLKVNNGVDMLTLLHKKVVRTSMGAVAEVLGPNEELNLSRIAVVFQDEKEDPKRANASILRAWSACHVTHLARWTPLPASVSRLDTTKFQTEQLDLLAKLIRVSFKLEALKPSFMKNDISEDVSFRNGKIEVNATRYKTRPKVSGSQSIRLEVKGENDASLKGRVTKVHGRNVSISVDKLPRKSEFRGIITVGKDGPTSAEALKFEIILNTLQGTISLFQNKLLCSLWFPLVRSMHTSPATLMSSSERPQGVTIRLNPSQLIAIRSMLRYCVPDDAVQLTMVHGPPGSGKTSVAAGFVEAVQGLPQSEFGEVIYLTAQSNVAVKNMAEKLANIGYMHWKVIVSHGFHFDWHEHLYESILRNVIVSATLPETRLETERVFRGVRVILCTLSMLSNKRLGTVTRQFPPRTIIVDEASQIELGDYLPVFHTFTKTLRRVCFMGDDKQLPPFGNEEISELQSVFELPEVRKDAIFLDTQYRMPIPIAAFISRKVYGGRLKSCHSNKNKTSCRWVDVHDGNEEKEGHSWKNSREIRIILHLVREAHKLGEEFKIITPYDPQRNELEKALKQAGLPWENLCFNVDSFQGNEADHIIVSVVRTKRPGFLNNERRTNVLLTRCKKKMTICTNRHFLEHQARHTLIGGMAASWGPDCWITGKDVMNGRI